MNTANLQLEGLLLALGALTGVLRRKGLLSSEEIDTALAEAQAAASSDALRPKGVSSSNVEAVLFPIRFLRAVNEQAGSEPFSAVAARVGRAKEAD